MTEAGAPAHGAKRMQGVLVAGRFLDLVDREPYENKAGETVSPVIAAIQLPGTADTVKVEYQSRAAAEKALGQPEFGGEVMIAVYADGAYDRETRRRGPVFFRGR